MTLRLPNLSTFRIALGAIAGIVWLSGTASACSISSSAMASCCPTRAASACGCCLPGSGPDSTGLGASPIALPADLVLESDRLPNPAAEACDCSTAPAPVPPGQPAERSGSGLERLVDLVRVPDPIATPADRPASDRPSGRSLITSSSSKIRLHLRLSHLLI